MSLSTHGIGHIKTGSCLGRGHQYIQLAKVVYCKLPTIGKQLSPFSIYKYLVGSVVSAEIMIHTVEELILID